MFNFVVIDCGMNIFYFLIVRFVVDGSFEEIYWECCFIKFVENGIECIGEVFYVCVFKVLIDFVQVISQYQVVVMCVLGIVVLCIVSNGLDFVVEVKVKIGLYINIIFGLEEV